MIRTYYKNSSGMYLHLGDTILDPLEALYYSNEVSKTVKDVKKSL